MQVAATHAALLLAQGAGRLIRTTTDSGVVAVLDPRLATARYGSFLKASLPPMWTTTDPQVVRKALARLASTATALRSATARRTPPAARWRTRRTARSSARRRPSRRPAATAAPAGDGRVPAGDEERDRPGRGVAVVAGDRVAGHRVGVAEAPPRPAERDDLAGLGPQPQRPGRARSTAARTPGGARAIADHPLHRVRLRGGRAGPVEEVGAAVVGDLHASGQQRVLVERAGQGDDAVGLDQSIEWSASTTSIESRHAPLALSMVDEAPDLLRRSWPARARRAP